MPVGKSLNPSLNLKKCGNCGFPAVINLHMQGDPNNIYAVYRNCYGYFHTLENLATSLLQFQVN